ncbi:MAG: hypothetical protein IAE67_05835 [Candidatus Competibacteraceae bacterium]|nr:hypothetical protein [Candidatus Competibacteraceae bacterium]
MNRKYAILFSFIFFLISSCKWPEYVGTYYSTNCNMLEKVEIHPDETVDLRYYGMNFSVNRPARINQNIITVLNRETQAIEYEFEYKNGALYETSGMDLNCVLKKDTLR